MAALAGASERFVQTKDQDREERLITEKLDFEEKLLDKRIGAEAEQNRLRRELDLRIAKLTYGPDKQKRDREEKTDELERTYNGQIENYSALFTFEDAKLFQFIPDSMDRYAFYAKGAGGHSFNIPYNKDDPIRSGKSILNAKADYKNVYDTMIAVAGADDKTLLDLGYTKAAQVKAQSILNKLDSALSSTISKVTSDGAQKDAEENIVSFGDDYLKIIDWDNLSSAAESKMYEIIPNALGISDQSYVRKFLPSNVGVDKRVILKPSLKTNIIDVTGIDGNNRTFNIEKPDDIIDKAVLGLINMNGHYRGARPEDHFREVKKEMLAAVGQGVTKKEIAQIPFNVATVLDQTATVDPNTGQIFFNDPDMMRAALSGTDVPIDRWKLTTSVGGVTKSEINPIYLRGRKFRSFMAEVNIASAGLDETLIPEPLSMIKNPADRVNQVERRLRVGYGIDADKMALRAQAVNDLMGVTRSMRKLLSGVSFEKGLNGTITIAQTGLAAQLTALRSGFQEFAGNYIANLTEEERGRYGGAVEAFFSNEEVTDQATADQMLSFLTHVLVYNLARTLENPTGEGARLSQSDVQGLAQKLGFERLFPTRQGQIASLNLIEAKAKYEADYIQIMLRSQDPGKMMMAHALRNQVYTDDAFMVPAGLAYSTAGTAYDRAFENISSFLSEVKEEEGELPEG